MKRSLLMLLALFTMFAVFSPAAGAEEAPMPPGDSVAAVDQSSGEWYLRNDDGSAQEFYFGDPGDIPLFGDWDGDSEDTPGVYRQSDGRIYLRNSNTQGIGDLWFYFGNPGDVPLAGDWDGDGDDTISVFRPSTNQFFIINELGKDGGGLGAAEYSFTFGDPGDVPFAGDWDGDGIDGVALHRESTGQVFTRNALSTGVAEASTVYGDPGDMMIGGDWDGDGVDTLGVYRDGQFFLQNKVIETGTGLGAADETFYFGEAGFYPLAGFFMSKIGTGRLDIVETARAADDFNVLVAALEATGLDDALKGPGPFTVFAPTDDAFAALPAGTVEALLGDLPALTRILEYHVAAGKLPASEVVKLDGKSAETIGGELVWIELKDGKVYVNDAEVIITDIYASNGIIHVIDTVLVPQDIVETASANEDFETLVTAIGAAGLADALSAPNGPYTVFAPTDDAFAALPDGVLDGLLADIPALQRVLKYHVASGLVPASEVVKLDGKSAETIGGELVWIELKDGKVYVNDAEVVITDIKTSNGIIHVIDAVLVPQDIVETAVANGSFTVLVEALQTAGLDDALSAPNGPYTVFAPTDDAFTALLGDLGITKAELLASPGLSRILQYHVASGLLPASEVVKLDGKSAETIGGELVWIELKDGKVYVNEAEVVIADVKTSNGIIHVIDMVLDPNDIVETATFNGSFTVLVEALQTAGLDDALSAPNGPYTVFAPTDDAFTALLGDLGITKAELLANPDLGSILTYHVLGDAYDSTAVVSWNGGTTPATLNGATIEVDVHDPTVVLNESTANSADIVTVDVKTSNGIIHVIDAVLLPPAS